MGARRARSGAGLAAPRLLLSEVSQAGAATPARVEPGGVQVPAGLEARQEISMARAIRAYCLASGQCPSEIALTASAPPPSAPRSSALTGSRWGSPSRT